MFDDGYVGEIKIIAFNSNTAFFPIQGWYACDGARLTIASDRMLFSAIGTKFGGDGKTYFDLPDFRGRVPIGMGTSDVGTVYKVGYSGGAESVALTKTQVPAHSHSLKVSTLSANTKNPKSAVLAVASQNIFSNASTNIMLSNATIEVGGNDEPHENIQPSFGLNFIINAYGEFPSPN